MPPTENIVRVAASVMRKVRSSRRVKRAVRLIEHVPNFDRSMRPISLFQALALGSRMYVEGFRDFEPITVTAPVFRADGVDLYVPEHVTAGNHRTVSSRDTGHHLLYAQVVQNEDLILIYEAVKKAETPAVAAIRTHDVVKERMYKAIGILMVVCNTNDVSPAPYTPLQQVAVIRTLVYNDTTIPRGIDRSGRKYGGFELLQEKFLGPDLAKENRRRARLVEQKKEFNLDDDEDTGTFGLDDHTRNHFLYCFSHCTRHMNRLVAGAYALIETYTSHNVPVLGEKSPILDVLLYWEAQKKMPVFKETQICYAGEISSSQLQLIMRASANSLKERNHLVRNGALVYTPICTPQHRAAKNGKLAEWFVEPDKRKRRVYGRLTKKQDRVPAPKKKKVAFTGSSKARSKGKNSKGDKGKVGGTGKAIVADTEEAEVRKETEVVIDLTGDSDLEAVITPTANPPVVNVKEEPESEGDAGDVEENFEPSNGPSPDENDVEEDSLDALLSSGSPWDGDKLNPNDGNRANNYNSTRVLRKRAAQEARGSEISDDEAPRKKKSLKSGDRRNLKDGSSVFVDRGDVVEILRKEIESLKEQLVSQAAAASEPSSATGALSSSILPTDLNAWERRVQEELAKRISSMEIEGARADVGRLAEEVRTVNKRNVEMERKLRKAEAEMAAMKGRRYGTRAAVRASSAAVEVEALPLSQLSMEALRTLKKRVSEALGE